MWHLQVLFQPGCLGALAGTRRAKQYDTHGCWIVLPARGQRAVECGKVASTLAPRHRPVKSDRPARARPPLPDAPLGRDEFIERMAKAGVGTSVHFIPLHTHPYWRELRGPDAPALPVADAQFNLAVSLDRLRQPKPAIEYYRRALALAESQPAGFSTDAARARLADLERAAGRPGSDPAAPQR